MTPSPSIPAVPVRRRGGIVRIILVNLMVFAGLVVLFEVGARIAGYGDRPKYVPEGELLWTLVPNQKTRNHVSCRPVTIDESGMRIVPGADDDPKRLEVLCLGNSVSFGYGVADDETYEALLQKGVEAAVPGRWRFRNGAVMGHNMYFMRLQLERLIRRGEKPDLLILPFTFNDRWTWPGEHYSAEDRDRIRRSVHFKNFARSIALYNLFNERLSPPQLYILRNKFLPFGFGFGPKGKPPATGAAPDSGAAASPESDLRANWTEFYRQQIHKTFDLVEQHDLPVISIVWPLPAKQGREPQQTFMEVCRERGIPFVDLQPITDRRTTPWPHFDLVHPEAETFRALVAEGILPFFLAESARFDSLRAASPAKGAVAH